MNVNKSNIWFYRILTSVIFFGIIAAIINFLHNRSLWFDESLLALNIVDKTYSELLQPLDYNQVAPIGFLFVEKFIAGWFDYNDWSLRIFPFLCYLGSIPLFYLFNKKLHGSKEISFIAVALFSINSSIVYYSFEVKQYSTDVFSAILLLFIGIKLIEDNIGKRSLIAYTIISMLVVFFSNVSIILLITNAILIFYTKIYLKKQWNHKTWIPIIIWLVSFVFYFSFFIYHHPSKRTMLRYWTQKNAFLPLNIFDSKTYQFLFDKLTIIFNSIIANNTFGWIYFTMFIIGLFVILKRKRILFILIFPLILHLILSGLKLYPFHTRLILYLIPLLLIVISFAIHYIFQKLQLRKMLYGYLVFTLLFINAYGLASVIPFEREQVKQCMDYIKKDSKKCDNIYLYCSTIPVFKFYQNRFNYFTKDIEIINGNWHRDDWSKHSQDIEKIKGDSWLIFSEVYISQGKSEADYIINLLKLKGFSILISKKFAGAICYKVSKN